MNIHATCVSIEKQGVLLVGKSGSGKSDLALRLITFLGAKLVADDRVDVSLSAKGLKASAPEKLRGLLEVRGVGIVKFPAQDSVILKMVVNLTTNPLERLPEKIYYKIDGGELPQISLNPFENSAPAKVLAALRLL